MGVAVMKKKVGPGKPGPKYTASDSARATVIKGQRENINKGLGVVDVYRKNYPGKDPAGLAAKNVPPRPGKSPTHEEDVQMRQVQDTTYNSALNQAYQERSNRGAGMYQKTTVIKNKK